jgi:hypothetical protein
MWKMILAVVIGNLIFFGGIVVVFLGKEDFFNEQKINKKI